MKKNSGSTEHNLEITDAELMEKIGNLYRPAPTRRPTKTTFQLTERGYELLNELANRQGSNVGSVLGDIADCLKGDHLQMILKQCLENPIQGKRIRRSYSVESQTLSALQSVQDTVDKTDLKVSRDDLIETTANLFCQLADESDKRRLNKLKQVLELYGEMRQEWAKGEDEIRRALPDRDHPIMNRLGFIEILMDNLGGAIQREIAGDALVDPDDISQG